MFRVFIGKEKVRKESSAATKGDKQTKLLSSSSVAMEQTSKTKQTPAAMQWLQVGDTENIQEASRDVRQPHGGYRKPGGRVGSGSALTPQPQ